MNRLLLCTDLDRTLLPNGDEPESEQARVIFKHLVSHADVTLAYATGRHQQLVEQAIAEYLLPQPDYVIADVGSSIYQVAQQQWQYQDSWENVIKHDWRGNSTSDIQELFSGIEHLQLQEDEKQNRYKLSYYIPVYADYQAIIDLMEQRLSQHSIKANLIWSVVQHTNIGLLDVLPASADKLRAIEFLMQQLDFDLSQTVFAGDSGNDVAVMRSPIQSVLVANSDEDIRSACLRQAQKNQHEASLYIARGGFMGMNGNYSAGIVEGVVHFIPHAIDWLTQDARV